MSERAERLRGAPERRHLACTDFALRKAAGDTLEFTGYASVFDAPYDILGGPDRGGWTEIVDPNAFTRTLNAKPDVHLLVNHEGMPLARTKSGTMQLSTDKTGLKVRADLDRRDRDVQSLEVKMERGDVDEMSFAFRTVRDQWNHDESERRLLEVNIDKGDVSIVNFGANPATSAALRYLTEALTVVSEFEKEAALAELRSSNDPVSALTSAHTMIGQLLREFRPKKRGGTLTIREAERILVGF